MNTQANSNLEKPLEKEESAVVGPPAKIVLPELHLKREDGKAPLEELSSLAKNIVQAQPAPPEKRRRRVSHQRPSAGFD